VIRRAISGDTVEEPLVTKSAHIAQRKWRFERKEPIMYCGIKRAATRWTFSVSRPPSDCHTPSVE
jgi:hypothetical protein